MSIKIAFKSPDPRSREYKKKKNIARLTIKSTSFQHSSSFVLSRISVTLMQFNSRSLQEVDKKFCDTSSMIVRLAFSTEQIKNCHWCFMQISFKFVTLILHLSSNSCIIS